MMVILRRNHVVMFLFSCCFLVASFGVYLFALHPNLKEWQRQGIVVSSVDTNEKAIALTIDDGPNPEATPEVLRVLQENQARATFFVLGVYAKDHPTLVEEIQIHGHEIGSHGYTHNIRQYNNSEFARSDVQRSLEVITSITGTRPRLLRPPGGFLSHDLVNYCKQEKLTIVSWTWNADYKDWKATNADSLADKIVAGVEPGQIILLHDGGENRQVMIRALSLALPKLSELGYRFVTVSELLAMKNK
ncbi:MAG: polysaccharide deacetylase family protein [Syntrophomonadales bacterium]|jgi:peptidoglycan/xylan/chitin deacetylase (PgdA/CDA1 family)